MADHSLYTPDQYADLVISDIEAEHHKRTGEMLHFGRYRDKLTEQFKTAINAALGQAVASCVAAGDDDPIPHINKHKTP